MNLKPLGDRVLVKPAPKEEKTSSGLYIASAAQELPQRGEVLAVGTGKLDQEWQSHCLLMLKSATRYFTASSVAPRSR